MKKKERFGECPHGGELMYCKECFKDLSGQSK